MNDPTRRTARPGRRDFLKGTATIATIASGATAAPFLLGGPATAQSGDDARTLDRLERSNADSRRRIVITGGTVISMDPAVGNFARADVLIEGKKISAVAPDLGAAGRGGNAIVVDAKDMILIPGFADPHIHSWEGQIGRIIPNSNGVPEDLKHNYTSVTHQNFALYYRPQDMYIGTLLTALSCVDAGITCMCDNSHNNRSAAHADAATRALFDSGVRGIFGYGGARFGEWDRQWPQDLGRIKKQYFSSDDQLVTLRMFMVGEIDPKAFQVARDLDLWISFDGGAPNPQLPAWYRDGLLVGHESFNHGGGIPDANWQVIRERGATINVCPRSDSQFQFGGAGRGVQALQDALDHGVRPGISNDNPAAYGIDMLTEMRLAYFTQRSLAQLAKFNGNPKPPAPVTVRDVLEFATIRGAACNGLVQKCGSLTPGKEADIVLIRTDNARLYPSNNAIGTVVQAAGIGDIDAVFIAGQARKWRGRMTSTLVGQNFGKLRQLADESRQYLLGKAGWPLDIFSD